VNIPARPDALAKRCFQTGWAIVFSQEIPERLIGERLEFDLPIAGQQSDRLPGLIIEHDTFSRHCRLH
jgi:hypothetical protein